MERKLIHPFIAIAALVVALPAVADVGPGGFTYEGRVYESDGLPSTRTVNMRLQILNPAGDCVLRDEVKSGVDLSATGGTFAVSVGTGTPHADNAGLTIANIYRNSGASLTGRNASNTLAGCTYSPAAGDVRKLRIWVDGVAMTPDITINSVPFAVSADHLRGKAPSDFVSINSSTAVLTQPNLENVFGDASKLANLLQIAQGNFTPKSTSSGVALPSYAGNPSTPVAGSIWFDSTANQLKYRDGSTVQTLSSGGGGVTSVTAGSGLMTSPGGGITTTGSISIATAGVVTTMLADGSVSTLKVADGSITSQKIADGTIVTADLSPGISIVTTGDFSTQNSKAKAFWYYNTAATQSVQVRAPAGLATSYLLTLPPDDGNAGQVLQTDGTGNLNWASLGGGGDFKADGSIPMTAQLQASSSGNQNTPQYTFIGDTDTGLYRNGPDQVGLSTNFVSRLHVSASGNVGIGTTAPQSVLHVYAPSYAETMYQTPLNAWNLRVGLAQNASALGFSHPGNTAYVLNEDNAPLVLGAGNAMKMLIRPDGNVAIGNSNPRAKLDVSGAIVSAPAAVTAGSIVDFQSGNVLGTSNACGAFLLHNLKDGGIYKFAVTNPTTGTCSFSAYSDAGSSALSVVMPTAHSGVSSQKSLYTFTVVGTQVFVERTLY